MSPVSQSIEAILRRAATWPHEAKQQLAEAALEIEAGLASGFYEPSSEELAGVDRGLEAKRKGDIATDEEVEAIFAKHR